MVQGKAQLLPFCKQVGLKDRRAGLPGLSLDRMHCSKELRPSHGWNRYLFAMNAMTALTRSLTAKLISISIREQEARRELALGLSLAMTQTELPRGAKAARLATRSLMSSPNQATTTFFASNAVSESVLHPAAVAFLMYAQRELPNSYPLLGLFAQQCADIFRK